jgi:alkylated DNA repair dioxygenase AlkB
MSSIVLPVGASMQTTEMGHSSWLQEGRGPPVSQEQLAEMWACHPAERGEIKMMGKVHLVPRFQQSYERGYRFSGMDHPPLPTPEPFQWVLEWANGLGLGCEFNQVLINWYRDGRDYIGTHSDDERQLVPDSPIVTLSLGAERTFRVRDAQKKIVRDVRVRHGTVLVMGGAFQREFKHEVPPISGKKGEAHGRRISITLRQFK